MAAINASKECERERERERATATALCSRHHTGNSAKERREPRAPIRSRLCLYTYILKNMREKNEKKVNARVLYHEILSTFSHSFNIPFVIGDY